MSFKRNAIFLWLMVALALTPAALYAYLGQFVRIMGDDYCHAARGQELGAWGGMLDRYNNWSGAYSSFFLSDALAPLDALPSMIMPPLLIALWLVGLFWLIDKGLTHLKISHSRRPLALAMAALALAAAVNGFPSPHSFYHYSASIRYTLPLALLTVYLVTALWLAGRWKADRLSYLSLIAGGLLCFVTAGASEMFMVFQLTFLTLCLLVSLAWRRVYARVFGVGWLATLAGLMIQLNAPGIALRAAWIEERFGRPDRSPLAWMSRTFDKTLEALGHPQIFVGFVLLLGLGLLAALFTYRPPKTRKTSKPVELVSSALWLCLMFQLFWLPILWSHSSNIPQFLGRFSLRYMVIIALNLAFILGFAFLLWRRGPINAYLQRHEHGLRLFCNGLLLIVAALFALTQLGSIYYLPASWLFVTALMFLGLLCWQLSSVMPGAETRKIGLLALCLLVMGLTCMTAVVGAAVFGRGFAVLRILSPGASLLAFSGLIWGFFLGCLVKHLPSQYGRTWINWLKLASLALVLIIGLGIVRGQITLAPDFQRYAQEWHQRHLDIIAQRDRGQSIIETAPLSYNMTDYAEVDTLSADWVNECARRYYGVDAIVVTEFASK